MARCPICGAANGLCADTPPESLSANLAYPPMRAIGEAPMPDKQKIYLPKQEVRKGMRHSYQGDNVVVVDPKTAKQAPAEKKGANTKVVGPA